MSKKLIAVGLLLLTSLGWGQTTVHTAGLEVPNTFINTNQFTLGVTVGPVLFANLGTIAGATNLIFITDGSIGSNPCTGGGTGALAVRISGVWNCAVGGGGGGGGISRWDQLTAPTNDLNLTMAPFASNFNYTTAQVGAFSWNNTSSATGALSQGSPRLTWCGQYWDGGNSLPDCWDIGTTIANGPNGTTLFSFNHGGSTGTRAVQVPILQIASGASFPNEFSVLNSATALTLPGVSNSAFGFQNDGTFQISENNAAFYGVTNAINSKVPCGAGACSLTLNGVLLGNNNGNITATAAGGTGTVLIGHTGTAPTFSGVLALGSAASTLTGVLQLCGSVAGCVTVQSQTNFTNFNFNLPTTAGTAGLCLVSGGGAANPMTWGACSGGGGGNPPLSSILAATATNSINNADFGQVWNFKLTSAGNVAFTFGESAPSTATGAGALVLITTLNGSTIAPLTVTQGAGPTGAGPQYAMQVVGGAGGPAANVTAAGNFGAPIIFGTGTGSAGGATSGDGGNGGDYTFQSGSGASASGGSNAGGRGGNINFTTGDGASGGASGNNGAAGSFTITIGKPGSTSSSDVTTNGFVLQGTQPLSRTASGSPAPVMFSIIGVTGGDTSGNGNTGGLGSSINMSGGTGGNANGTSGIGGAGGGISLTAGAGGSSAGASANAKGGDLTMNLGAAGGNGAGAAGAAGQLKIIGATVGGVLTGAFVNITGTWNTSGVVDAAFVLNITNTASGTASRLMALKIGGTTEFAVDKAGITTQSGLLNRTGNYFTLQPASNASPGGTLILDAPSGFVQIQADSGAGATLGGQLHLESTNGPNGLNTASLLAGSNGIQMDTATGTRINSDTSKKTIITGPGTTQFGDVGGTGGSTSYVGTTSGTQTLACDSLSLCTAFRMTGTLLLGTDATTAGVLKISNGGGSGASYTLDNNAATTAITEHLPALAASGLRTGTNSSGTVTGGWSGDTNHIVTSTGLTASLGTTTLCTTTNCPAGVYHVDVYMNEAGTGCTSVGAGGVAPALTYADGVSTKSAQPMGGFSQAGNSLGAGKLLFVAAGTNDATYSDVIRTDGSATIQIATTLTACTTPGPWAGYNIRAVIYPVSGQ